MPTTKINWSDAGQENEHLCRAGWPGGQGTLHYSCSVRARQTGWQRPDRSRADPFGGDKCQTSPISLRLPVGPSFPPCLCGSSCGHGGKGTLLSWHAVFVGILERKKKKRRESNRVLRISYTKVPFYKYDAHNGPTRAIVNLLRRLLKAWRGD